MTPSTYFAYPSNIRIKTHGTDTRGAAERGEVVADAGVTALVAAGVQLPVQDGIGAAGRAAVQASGLAGIVLASSGIVRCCQGGS